MKLGCLAVALGCDMGALPSRKDRYGSCLFRRPGVTLGRLLSSGMRPPDGLSGSWTILGGNNVRVVRYGSPSRAHGRQGSTQLAPARLDAEVFRVRGYATLRLIRSGWVVSNKTPDKSRQRLRYQRGIILDALKPRALFWGSEAHTTHAWFKYRATFSLIVAVTLSE